MKYTYIISFKKQDLWVINYDCSFKYKSFGK